MKWLLLPIVCIALTAGCQSGKPGEDECRKAVENIERLTRKDGLSRKANAAAIRSCQARSSKEFVKCATDARTLAELERCEGEVGQEYYERAHESAKETLNQGEEPAPKPETETETETEE
jgi:hypothetical protein